MNLLHKVTQRFHRVSQSQSFNKIIFGLTKSLLLWQNKWKLDLLQRV